MRGKGPISICGELYDYRGSHGIQCINLKDDRIESITEKPRGEHLDFTGSNKKVIPGLIDIHVHLRGLQLSYKEDENTGTLQALKAGITLVIDMPNTRPYINTPETIREKLDALRNKSWTDYSIYSGIPPSRDYIEKTMKMGIAGYKAYPNDLAKTTILDNLLQKGNLLVVHPEYLSGLKMLEVEDIRSRGAIRGCYLESLSVELLASQGLTGRLHITHASCPLTVWTAKRAGYSVDVTPHHLFYDYNRTGCLNRVNPPLRSPGEASKLIQLVLYGLVDAFASDHAPHSQQEKTEPLTCSPGFPWLPLWPWLVYSRLVKPGAIGLSEFLYYTSRGPAEILGLRDYGIIDYGARANIVVFDPDYSWRFPGFLDSKHKLPVHFMESLRGIPEYVFVGGRLSWSKSDGFLQRGLVINPFTRDTSL